MKVKKLVASAVVLASLAFTGDALTTGAKVEAACLGQGVPASTQNGQFQEKARYTTTCNVDKIYAGSVFDLAADGFNVYLWTRKVNSTSNTWVKRVSAVLTNNAYNYQLNDNDTSSQFILCLGDNTNPNNNTQYCGGIAENWGY